MTLLFLTFMHVPHANGQVLSNQRSKTIAFSNDTLILDSLSIIPESFIITDTNDSLIDTSFYKYDFASSKLWFTKNNNLHSQLKVQYRVFPQLFSKKYYHKDISLVGRKIAGAENPFNYEVKTNQADEIFAFGGLNRNGSISRGISFGNNQDVVVNSSLNLQLSGRLSDDVEVLAAITDNNVPIQPEGNTQQIQDFDKVFIQFSRKNDRLIAGDFEMKKPNGYFLNLYKKAQGLSLTTTNRLNKKDKEIPVMMRTSAGGAISKGKYARQIIEQREGNRGPYKLKGNNGELFIIVLSGTEKVYIDGVLLQRGQDRDYVIDYNMGEVTFTPKRMITKDSRITVEFEYSDRNYARSMFLVENELNSEHWNLRINAFSEQDAKNQPILADLSDKEKRFLGTVGDSLQNALYPNVDSVGFNTSEILYRRTDSLVDGILYDSIFVYSTNPNDAYYRLGFTKVPEGFGNYVLTQNAANGRVFKWLAPINGVSQGNYEPVILLITPKKQQMFTIGTDYMPNKNTRASIELAVSQQDINLFSSRDDKDNTGLALRFNIENKKDLIADTARPLFFKSSAYCEMVEHKFVAVERFRTAEFTRDWNLGAAKNNNNEQIIGAKLSLTNEKGKYIGYSLSSLQKGPLYQGMQHSGELAFDKKNFFLTSTASLLNTNGDLGNSIFIRHQAKLEKRMKIVTLGIKEEQEDNRFKATNTDTLSLSSYKFQAIEWFASNSDTTKRKINLYYRKRQDLKPLQNAFSEFSRSNDIGLSTAFSGKKRNTLLVEGIYRNLKYADTLKGSNAENLVGRIEYRGRWLKGTIISNTFYEVGSGLELKKEFTYIEVAPGQGVYAWTDYNSNGIQELNEFEIAAFPDQAKFVRVFIPTNQYIKANSNAFNQSLTLNPESLWESKKGLLKLISRLSNQSVFRVDRKSTVENLLEAYNPFLAQVNDSTLLAINSAFRNTFSFNRNSAKIGVDLNYLNNNNKMLMTNGFDTRSNQEKGFKIRWNITREFTLLSEFKDILKKSKSEYFHTRDFTIKQSEIIPEIAWQPGTTFRIALNYRYANKLNQIGTNEEAVQQTFGSEVKYNVVSKGSLTAKVSYIILKYNSDQNTSLAYEMLEGLKIGKNITWNLSYQRNLSNHLQLNFIYDGRKPDGLKIVHIGNVQLRAFF